MGRRLAESAINLLKEGAEYLLSFPMIVAITLQLVNEVKKLFQAVKVSDTMMEELDDIQYTLDYGADGGVEILDDDVKVPVQGKPVKVLKGEPVHVLQGVPIKTLKGQPMKVVHDEPLKPPKGQPMLLLEGAPVPTFKLKQQLIQKQQLLKEEDERIKMLQTCLHDIRTSVQNVSTYTTDDIKKLQGSVGKCNALLTQSLANRVKILKEIDEVQEKINRRQKVIQQKRDALKELDGQIKNLRECLDDIQKSVKNVSTYNTSDTEKLQASSRKCIELLSQTLSERIQLLQDIDQLTEMETGISAAQRRAMKQKKQYLKELDGQIQELHGCLSDIETSVKNVSTYSTGDVEKLQQSAGKCNEFLTQSLDNRLRTLQEIDELLMTGSWEVEPTTSPPVKSEARSNLLASIVGNEIVLNQVPEPQIAETPPPPPRDARPQPPPPPPPPRDAPPPPPPPPRKLPSPSSTPPMDTRAKSNLMASIVGNKGMLKPTVTRQPLKPTGVLEGIVGNKGKLKSVKDRVLKPLKPLKNGPGLETEMGTVTGPIQQLLERRIAIAGDDDDDDDADWDSEIEGGGRLRRRWLMRKFNTYC